MKNIELFRLRQGCENVMKLKGARFAVVISKNYEKLNSEIEHLVKAVKPSDDYEKYTVARIELCKSHANVDAKGAPIILNNDYQINPKQQIKFDKELEVLQKEYEEVIAEHDKKIEEYTKLLQEEVVNKEFKLITIDFDKLPSDITGEQVVGIKEMIVD